MCGADLQGYGELTRRQDYSFRFPLFSRLPRNYYRFHTDREWGVAANYNLALDSGVLGEELCVELICKAMQK